MGKKELYLCIGSFDGYYIFKIVPYYLRVYIKTPTRFVSYFEMKKWRYYFWNNTKINSCKTLSQLTQQHQNIFTKIILPTTQLKYLIVSLAVSI